MAEKILERVIAGVIVAAVLGLSAVLVPRAWIILRNTLIAIGRVAWTPLEIPVVVVAILVPIPFVLLIRRIGRLFNKPQSQPLPVAQEKPVAGKPDPITRTMELDQKRVPCYIALVDEETIADEVLYELVTRDQNPKMGNMRFQHALDVLATAGLIRRFGSYDGPTIRVTDSGRARAIKIREQWRAATSRPKVDQDSTTA